jgi:hypothetical protein
MDDVFSLGPAAGGKSEKLFAGIIPKTSDVRRIFHGSEKNKKYVFDDSRRSAHFILDPAS